MHTSIYVDSTTKSLYITIMVQTTSSVHVEKIWDVACTQAIALGVVVIIILVSNPT